MSLLNVDLSFTDFAMLAILLAIMYGLTILEFYLGSGKNRNFQKVNLVDPQRAATWAFFGLLATILTGIFAEYFRDFPFEMPLVIIPLFFILRWGIYQLRLSKLIKTELIEETVDTFYEKKILGVLQEAGAPMKAGQVFHRCTTKFGFNEVLSLPGKFLPEDVFPSAWSHFVERLCLTEERTMFLLENLVKRDLISKHNNQYRFRKT